MSIVDPITSRRSLDDQLAPAWVEWLAYKTDALDRFVTHDVPQLPQDRYSETGIRIAERALLTRFTALETADPADPLLTRFGCYLGEVFTQSLDGHWYNDPFPDARLPRATVRFLYADVRLCVREQVVLALHYRSGTYWSQIYRVLSDQCAAWWESGHSRR
ncbi:hypothetical protein ACIHDR_43265 [Nocardia sp. NPDC052278]|uniref:hypothetical protein n=1 Tax=unclassified Nocardia TaxID=2637762 RepID=UPI0036AA80C4